MASAPSDQLPSLEAERSSEIQPGVHLSVGVLVLVGVAALGWVAARNGPGTVESLAAVLHVVAGLAAAATAALLFAGTHVVGNRQRAWAGVVVLLAAVGLGGRLAAEAADLVPEAVVLNAVWPAGLLTAAAVAAAAVRSSWIRTLRLRTLVAAAVGVQGILAAAAATFAGAATEPPGVPAADVVLAVSAAPALLAAGLCLYRGSCTRDQVLVSLGAMLVGFATAEMVDLAAASPVIGAVLRTAGVGAAGFAAARFLSTAITLQRRRVADAVVGGRVDDARAQAARRDADERARQESVILTSLEAAWTVLRGASGPVDDATATALSEAIDSELERLRALVDQTPQSASTGLFDCKEAVERAVDATARDRVALAVPPGLFAAGCGGEIAEALGLLLRQAQVHSHDPLHVTARREGEHVVLRLDTGRRGPKPTQTTGPGFRVLAPHVDAPVDVLVARRLIADQGGALGVAQGAGGPFLVLLPTRPKPAEGALDEHPDTRVSDG